MNVPADRAGRLLIDVSWHEDRIQRVQLTSTRPQQVTRLLRNRSVEEVLSLVPMLYRLCSVAQKVAALEAVESALGIDVSPEVLHARQLLVQAETARELGLRLASRWLSSPEIAAGLMRWFVQWQQRFQWALELNPSEPDMPIAASEISAELKQLVVALLGVETDLNTLLFDTGHPVGAPLRELQNGLGDIELADPAAPLRLSHLNAIEGCLASDLSEQFCRAPLLAGEACETSIWSRNCQHSLVAEGKQAGLNSLSLRWLALVAGLHALPAQMRNRGQDIVGFGAPGTGVVEAARGLLIHRVELEGDSVRDYQIVAPTEWNFHPQGTLVKMLEGVSVERERVRPLVEALVLLVDPCVDWQIEVGH